MANDRMSKAHGRTSSHGSDAGNWCSVTNAWRTSKPRVGGSNLSAPPAIRVERPSRGQKETKVKRMILAAIAAIGASVGSPQAAHSSGYLTPFTEGVSVSRYHMHGGGGMTITVSGISNPDGCGGTSLVHIPSTLSGYKEMVAAVMTAVATGKRIGLWSTGCSLLPFWGGSTTYPVVNDLWVIE
jgi:hypothetical protein